MSGGKLPGDVPAAERLARGIRLDHAAEYAAARIYAGQLAVLAGGGRQAAARQKAERARQNLAAVAALMVGRRVRPTALLPLWHVGGYALGALGALAGERAAAAWALALESAADERHALWGSSLEEGAADVRATLDGLQADPSAAPAPGRAGEIAGRVLKLGIKTVLSASERL